MVRDSKKTAPYISRTCSLPQARANATVASTCRRVDAQEKNLFANKYVSRRTDEFMNREVKPVALFNTGALIVNADDWGMDRDTTDQILKCASCGSVSSASGMVFMEDSE